MGSEPDEFDELLRASIESYCPEPRAGMEDRLLWRLRSEHQIRRRGWLLALALPLSILVLLLVLVRTTTTRPPVASPVARIQEPASIPVAALAVHKAVLRRRKPGLARPLRPHPFPTPTPLTEEERALQEIVAVRPRDMQSLFARKNDEPLAIQDLEIPPLQSDGGF